MENRQIDQFSKERSISVQKWRMLAVLPGEMTLIAEVENLQEELHCLQEAVAAAQPFVSPNLIRVSITIKLLQYRDSIGHIDQSRQRGSISGEEAHRQKSKLADICAAHITDLVCQQVERPVLTPGDTQHHYLVQFRKSDWQFFRTDCTFKHGQLDLAMVYVWSVVDALEDVEEGRVVRAATHSCVHGYQ